MAAVSVRHLAGGKLVGVARRQAVLIDKLPEGGGEGLGLISTEFLLLSLGSCMSFNMLYYAERNNWPVTDLRIELADEVAEAPTRIAKIVARVHLAGNLTQPQLDRLLATVRGCKIHNTLLHLPEVEISLHQE
jgi:uncharacterized OsmC-like protein